MKQNYTSIICSNETHINKYEVGGVEYNTGCKIVVCDSKNTKIAVEDIQKKLTTRGNFNYAYLGIVVISQITELGTCYTCQEIKDICDFCHKNDLYVYVDGARLANALAFKTIFIVCIPCILLLFFYIKKSKSFPPLLLFF